MRASQQQQTPLRWVLYGLAALVTLWLYSLWSTPAMGRELHALAESGVDLEVLGIGRHSASVIFLHGLSGSGTLGLPLVERVREDLLQVSWILPSAPAVPVTANDGELMSAWFDIDELNIVSPNDPPPMPTREDESGMRKSVARVHALIQKELDKGIDANRIVLGGFSQGCVISLLAAISSKEKLGGVMCLSGWLAMSDKLEKHGGKLRHPMQEPHAHELPVFWGHGDLDNVVAHSWGEESVGKLHKMGFRDVEFYSYPALEHYMSVQEEKDVATWLSKRLPPT
ncbi:hypothetical protein JCM3775_004575 [Rhodotorula graminis]